MSARTCGAARRATTFEHKNRQGARRVVSAGPPACGWLRGTSRTSPGLPRRWRRPVWLRSTSARGRGFAAYLSACGGQPLQRPRCGLRQGGLRSLRSASSLSFLVTCRRQVIPSHSFAALAALVVRRVSDLAALFVRRVKGIAALFVRRVSGYAGRPMLCLYWLFARPPEGHWRAHPAAAPCRRSRRLPRLSCAA